MTARFVIWFTRTISTIHLHIIPETDSAKILLQKRRLSAWKARKFNTVAYNIDDNNYFKAQGYCKNP